MVNTSLFDLGFVFVKASCLLLNLKDLVFVTFVFKFMSIVSGHPCVIDICVFHL